MQAQFKIFSSSLSAFLLCGCFSTQFNEAENQAADSLAAVTLQDGPHLVGEWQGPFAPPADAKDVNPVHAVLLPSGKILMVGGSSNRNVAGGLGVEITRADQLNLIDFAAVFDPVNIRWTRVPGFPASVKSSFERAIRFGVDPFCAGHLLLKNGKVLFAGGTGSYSNNFQGSSLLWAFDEKSNQWDELPPMSDGRWYPTLLALPNGKVAIISGLNDGPQRSVSDMLDIYDPETNQLQSVNLKQAPGYPYGNGNLLEHYPRIHPLNSGRFLITSDGSGLGPVSRRSSTFMTISSDGDTPQVSFETGPTRPAIKKLYGTALVDPNSPAGDILLIGGMAGVGDPGVVTPKSTPNTPTVTSMERYSVASNSWSIEPNFLGNTPADSRTGLYSIILPTGQFLVINGSNYIQNRGTYNPILYTPNGPGQYTSKKMQRAKFPRFYHNVALLLPDGRVWVNGSNRDRAIVSPDGKVDQGNVPPGVGSDPDIAKTDGAAIPAGSTIEREFTKVEIFSPPYLFDAGGKRIADNARPVIESAPQSVKTGAKAVKLEVSGAGPGGKVNLIKFGSATHAWDNGQKFVPLDVSHGGGKNVAINLPTNGFMMPPGHYLMFYVNKNGVPSKGRTVLVEPK